MKKIHITELVLRDGHQCQIATRLRTEDMLPICPQLDSLGFWSIEAWGGATFDACVRFLKEDPWERLKLLRKALPNSRIQMLLRGQNFIIQMMLLTHSSNNQPIMVSMFLEFSMP
ncbi:MAG: Pyruvate carboxylase subunit [Pseudomonadota bacterium]